MSTVCGIQLQNSFWSVKESDHQFIHSKMLNLEICSCRELSLLLCGENNMYFNKNTGVLNFSISSD